VAEFVASSPKLEIIGAMIGSLWEAFPDTVQNSIRDILTKRGLVNISPQEWYVLQPVLDALKEIEERFGHNVLAQVGEQAALKAPFPPDIKTFTECMPALNVAIQRMHRNGSPGGYEVQEETSTGVVKYRVTASTPFPCSLTRGYLETLARRFAPPGALDVLILHKEDEPCRRNGANTCTYVITVWS
jgi:hypothetical protein